ncbi:Protein BIG GRAIN 1-like [Dichanthelium oligosanthes]|uniref:Protein BIG GRAIN 1-like n=1 Tax=Dichanthelium oligosanthes TaxID=888268 RepID=A0A1E5UWW5_9POAL|nr:Protein BIG GRAIN 1-like [Dichanthelium oligosanthes]
MERWAPAPARERPRRRAGQPSFSSTLLDAICDSLDEQPGGPGPTAERAAARTAGSAKKKQEAALHYYYYKPSLAASHRAAPAPADDCSGRGYFSSSEVEYSLRRLRLIRTSGGVGATSVAPAEKQQQPQPAPNKARSARKPSAASARCGCRRPASPGARIASLINAIFSGKRHSARQHPAPVYEEPACSTAPSTARPCNAKTPPSARARARASRSRSRTVRFLDIDGEVAVAAAAAGCRRVPVVEVEEDSDGGEESSDASSDLFELENLAPIAPGSGGAHCRRACGDELPVYGTTGAGLRHDIGRRHPFGYGSHGRSCNRVV